MGGTNNEEFFREFLDLMKYITESTDAVAQASDSRRLKRIHENVRKIKLSEKMVVKYMQKWEELAYAREDGRAEGLMEGEALKLIGLVCKKLAKGKETRVIADELEEEVPEVECICQIAGKYAPEYDCREIYRELRVGH